MSEKNLIVNADDYGLTRNVSRGIREAHMKGIVTSTSVMMNSDGVAVDLQEASQETPTLGLGIHLNLTFGNPVLPPHEVPSLVDQHGCFFKIRTIQERFHLINPDHLYNEWRAQIEKMLELGFQPDHLDSHQHVSYRNKTLFEIMQALAYECNLPIRKIPPHLVAYAADTSIASAPDAIEARWYGERATNQFLSDILESLQPGTTELMVHPGHPDDILCSKSSYTTDRLKELTILTSEEAVTTIDELGIRLVTFEQLNTED